MTKSEAVQKQQELPLLATRLLPGRIIQIQEEIVGAGDKVRVEFEQIASVETTWSGEHESFLRNSFFRCVSGKLLGHDLQDKSWWRIYERKQGPNEISPICVFPIE